MRNKVKLMLDICSGLGGASAAMKERGWQVVTVDNEPSFNPDVCVDIRNYSWTGRKPDLVWCSPPCTEFARESMPWCRTGTKPDMSLVLECKRFIDESRPRYWVIENVRGAAPWFRTYFGPPAAIYGPYFLWGFFPPLDKIRLNVRKKESYGSNQAAERAKIPYKLSLALAMAIESQEELV